MLRSLVAGTVYVAAESDPAPRAKELLDHECGPFSKEERKNLEWKYARKPLLDTNPQLCDRLKQSTRPEAFVLRYEGKRLTWYLFSYQDVGDRLRILDLYTKVAVVIPELHADCNPRVDSPIDDVGSAPLWQEGKHSCWGGPTLETLDPDQVPLSLCYTYRHPFRRTSKKLETDQDGR